MQTNQDTTQDLRKCTVAIQRSSDGKVLGTGVIVTSDGLILTCYHVVGDIKGKTLDEIVDIYFPSISEIKVHGQPIKQYCDPKLDIALLQLQEKLPEQISVAELGDTVYAKEHIFQSFGFRNPEGTIKFEGLPANGTIQAKTRVKSKGNSTAISPLIITLQSNQIAKGMSGAPVLDTETNKIVGIISDRFPYSLLTEEEKYMYRNLSFAIPIESILKVYPELKENNPGLKKFNNFLKAIGKCGSLLYDRLEDVYVPPIEYEEIEKTLKENGCVFITGTAEYGKTYTAIKLLWEYYKIGYTPKYIEISSKEAADIIKKLVDLDKKILENSIIYFEDPVGKIKYQPNKEFEESIGSIIAGLGSLNVRLIVTMRDEIYQNFNRIGKEDLKQYIKKLNIANQSYDYEKRKEILLKWAEVMSCKWLQDENLKAAVLDSIKNKAKLPTPLNIKDFVMETTKNINIFTKEQLLEIVNKQSQSTPKRFATDIVEMEEYGEIGKVLFLSFAFISDSFSVGFIKAKYQGIINDKKLVKQLKIEDVENFEEVYDWFRLKDNRLDTSNGRIRFSHPSYSEAIKYIISDDGSFTKSAKILSSVLINLHNDNFAASDVAKTIASNFDRMPENLQKLLFEMANDNIVNESVAEAIQSNFDKIPANTLFELLVKLTNKDYKFWNTAEDVADSIAYKFNKLPENVRNILFEMSNDSDMAMIVDRAITDNFDKLPENTRNELLVKLADKGYSYKAVSNNFDKLPPTVRNDLLLKLADNKYAAKDVAYIIARNFDKLPGHVWSLVLNLAGNSDTARYVAKAIADNFDKLPPTVRNDLLLKLADNKYAAKDVANAVATNFDKLPENTRNELLVRLADNQDGAANDVYHAIANAVATNFDKLPENTRNELLLKVSDNENAAKDAIRTIAKNFDKLPENVQNLLFKLADKYGETHDVAYVIARHFDKLPENTRNELLVRLAYNKYAVYAISNIVASNFDALPANVQNLLFKLADNKDIARVLTYVVVENFDKLPVNVRNELQKRLAKHGYDLDSAVWREDYGII